MFANEKRMKNVDRKYEEMEIKPGDENKPAFHKLYTTRDRYFQ